MSGVTCQVCHTGVSYRCVICTDVMTCQVCRTGVLYRYVVQVCCTGVSYRCVVQVCRTGVLSCAAGIAGLFTIFSSFVFSVGVVNFFGSDLTGLK